MTEAEAIRELKVKYLGDSDAIVEAKELAINALEKMQKLEENKTYFLYRSYLSLGTVEELRTLKEKQIAKKIISPLKIENVIGGYCPTCNGTVSIAETWLVKTKGQHCTWCGQKLKWQDSEV